MTEQKTTPADVSKILWNCVSTIGLVHVTAETLCCGGFKNPMINLDEFFHGLKAVSGRIYEDLEKAGWELDNMPLDYGAGGAESDG